MLRALFSPEAPPVLPRTLATWSASSCHRLLGLLCAENAAELPASDSKLLNQMLLQMTETGISDTFQTPVFDDGSYLTLDLSVAEQATLTAYATWRTTESVIVTPVHPAWPDVYNGPEHAALVHEWRNWAAKPAPGERRTEALRRVTECVVWGETELHLDNLGLRSLPDLLPPLLKAFYVCNNQLRELPELPNGLTILMARNNWIDHAPDLLLLPDTLTILDMRHNSLTTLPDLPASLRVLDISDNQLSALPDLPVSLRILDASDNQLSALPDLPASLRMLDASDNVLTALPDLPAGIQHAFFFNNFCSPV